MSDRGRPQGGHKLWQVFRKWLSVVRIVADRAVEYIAVIRTVEDHGPSAIELVGQPVVHQLWDVSPGQLDDVRDRSEP